jgi:hypothetical protein
MRSLLVVVSVAAGFLSGCARNGIDSFAVYPPPPPISPASESQAVLVYSGPPPVATAVPGATLPGTGANPDIALAESISRLLKGEPDLASVSAKVSATVHEGVVTLRGRVLSESDREEIVERVSKVPGVTHVVDHLGMQLR